MRRLTGLDAAFLYGETPAWHMHVSALLVADPSTAPNGFSFERLREVTKARLPQLPQFRWKLHQVPLGLDRPGWVEDEDFDIDYHIRHIAVPPPGGPHQIGELIGDLVSYKLDRSKPLWEMWVIEGLEHGHVAVLTKIHHSIIDGVSGAELAQIILDLQPEPAPIDVPTVASLHDQRVPGIPELLGRGIGQTLLMPWRITRYSAQLVAQGLTLAGFARRRATATLPFQAPRTPFNGELTPHRGVATASVPLSRVKVLKDKFDVKLNDVVLSLCATTLRRYLKERDQLPDQPLIAQVPVSIRSETDSDPGNKVAAMFASLATDVEDPALRLQATFESTRSAKEMRRALDARKIMGLTDTTPPGLIALAARMYTAASLDAHIPPPFNVIISNVPGPPFPLYMAGAKLLSLSPMGPLLYGGGLNITVISYMDQLEFGFLACPELVPDLWSIADGIEIALEELEESAGARS
ncbi:MAG: diacylglycerol O-acyltransferase [Actinomycetia bacterium]|nr:diacylglycerol O-acyltransferase [Actinomycetes bacterium]